MGANYIQQALIDNSEINASVDSVSVQLDGGDVGTLQVIHGANIAAKTFDSGEVEVVEATFETKANTDPGDYIVIPAQDGSLWAIAADVSGSDPEPTGAVWVSIPAGQKGQADLSGATTAAQVAAAFETAFNALTGFTALVTTDDTANDGTMTFTQVVRGVTEDPEVHNADDSGAGSIQASVTNQGVDSEVNVDESEITIPSHGLATGTVGQLTSTGTLPDPLLTATNYYVIDVDANAIKFATSYANAVAGTAITLVDQGSDAAVNTFTATAKSGSLQPQVTNVGSPAESDWINKGSAISLSGGAATTSVEYDRKDIAYSKYRLKYTHTAGQFSLKCILNLKT